MAKMLSPVPTIGPIKPPSGIRNTLSSFLRALGQKVDDAFTSTYVIEKDPNSPTPTATPTAVPTPTATPTPTPTPPLEYRHPRWDERRGSKDYQELISATKLANEKYSRVPQDLLMDLSMIESGGRPVDQVGGPAQGYYQFEPGQKYIPIGFNPYSATESAELAAREINRNMLSKWGVPGGTWGALDASRRDPANRLSTYYTPEELNQFLAEKYRFAL